MTRAISLLFHDVYVADPADSGFVSDAANRYKLTVAEFDAQLDAIARLRHDAPVLVDGRGGSEERGDGSSQSTPGGEDRGGAAPIASVPPAFGRPDGSQRAADHKPLDQSRACDPLPAAIQAARSAATEDLGASAISAPPRSLRSTSRRPQPALRPEPAAQTPWLVTFDDGGVSYHTLIADRLEAHGWRGHCFVSTDFIGRRGFLDATQIRDLDARGHVIGSHSASHPARFSTCAFPHIVREWRDSRRRLEDLLGHGVHVASVPGGYFSAAVAAAARDAGLTALFTSEPVTTIDVDAGLTLIGRFTIRDGDAPDAAMRFLTPAAWARSTAWLSWNAKGLVKPLLGPAYSRVADRLYAIRRGSPVLASSDVPRGQS